MRVVLDTNVVASGLLWGGAPAQLLYAANAGEIELCSNAHLLAELAGILQRAKFAKAIAVSGLTMDELVLGDAELVGVVDHVRACALAAKADAIVSGDRHLHSLGASFQGIVIVPPSMRAMCLG